MQTLILFFVLAYSQSNQIQSLGIGQNPAHYLPGIGLGLFISLIIWTLYQQFRIPLFLPLLLLLQEPHLPVGTCFSLLALFLFFSQKNFQFKIENMYQEKLGLNRFGINLYIQCLLKSKEFWIQIFILLLSALFMSPSLTSQEQLLLACILVWR